MDISTFVAKHRKTIKEPSISEKIDKLPWYKKPIERSAFISRKGKDGNLYVRHKEWSEKIYIGPYTTKKEVKDIIDSYVNKSAEKPLNKIVSENDIHSVYVDNLKEFFV
jgi:hypothetical protein